MTRARRIPVVEREGADSASDAPVRPESGGIVVWLSAYNGFSDRYFLRTGLVDRLLSLCPDLKIVLLVRKKDVAPIASVFTDPRIHVRPLAYEEVRAHFAGTRIGARLGQIRLMVLDRRAPHATADIWTRKFFAAYAALGLLHRVAQVYLRAAVAVLRRSRMLRRGLRALEARLERASLHADIFTTIPPDLVVVPSLGYFLHDAYLIREARERGVATLGVVTNWDHTTSKGMSGALPDAGLVWGRRSEEEARVHHDMAASAIEAVGPAHYDHYFDPATFEERAVFLLAAGLAPKRQTVLFAAMSPRPYLWNPRVLDILARAAAEGRFGRPTQILFRLHPNHLALRNQDPARWKEEMSAIKEIVAQYRCVAVQEPLWSDATDSFSLEAEDALRLANAIAHADAVVTVFSTLNLEAAILDRPTVNCALYGHDRSLGDDDRSVLQITHLENIFACGNSRIVETEDELVGAIADCLADPALDRDGRRRLIDAELGPWRGGGADRLAGAILRNARAVR